MKKAIVGIITILAAAVIVGCSSSGASDAASTIYTDGTYTGVGLGKEGPINVTLTIANDVITVDEITHSGETEGIGGKEAIEDGTFKAQIEEAQSAEIDGIVGATITSDGVRGALEDALEQALASDADKAA